MAEALARGTRAAVIVNPSKVDAEALRAAVEQHEQAEGWQPSLWIETTVEDPGSGQVRRALDEQVALVIAAGGDGTVRAAAAALRDSGVPLAIVPAGTGNLLARNLELPLGDPAAAVRVAFTGTERAIDLGIIDAERVDGEVDQFVFLVMAGVGLDAQMVANTNPQLKAKVGWLAYVDAIARSLRSGSRVRLRYRLDTNPDRAMTAHTVLIGNCGMLPGNIALLPDAEIDDGRLDVVALAPRGFRGWLRIWSRVVWENGLLRRTQVGRWIVGETKPIRALRYLTGERFIARFPHPEEFEVDGDPAGEVVALRATVDHQALAVMVSAEGTPEEDDVGR
ncbi:diacylglycerol/lipid kinase family protein [Ruicaihuangia caeni]|uniref:diacylglycerol/lipid kinase family protein n=1 Tax=Ruicaihuangia caeni TaxID=3042517 RepID=UPI00338E15F0